MTFCKGTSSQYAYEDDSDLDWMRHVFQGGGSATAANDNWVGIDYGYDASHRLTSTSATDSRIMGAIPTAGAYGAANALNQVASVPNRAPMTWSDAGNMQTDGKGTTFVHDGNNRLIKATKANSDTYHFRYDGDGLRMETIKNPDPTLSANFQHTGGTKTRYVTSATEEIADLDGNRIVLRRYIAGPAIDERVAQVDATGNVTYIHTDKQNSVVALSNSSGTAISRRGYGTYGETNASQMAETTHPFGYTGRRWEADLGLYYYRARWYDPELGTFLETDPIGSLDYVNLYSYVSLDPMDLTDPIGMLPECKTNESGEIVCEENGQEPTTEETVVVTAQKRRKDKDKKDAPDWFGGEEFFRVENGAIEFSKPERSRQCGNVVANSPKAGVFGGGGVGGHTHPNGFNSGLGPDDGQAARIHGDAYMMSPDGAWHIRFNAGGFSVTSLMGGWGKNANDESLGERDVKRLMRAWNANGGNSTPGGVVSSSNCQDKEVE